MPRSGGRLFAPLLIASLAGVSLVIAALAARAQRQGWSEAQTKDFRRSLLDDPEYRELEAQRLADIPRLATATANLVTL
ncbi:MAG: hypothetical protein ACKO9D_10095 [Gammaproteobacteria bacterium]